VTWTLFFPLSIVAATMVFLAIRATINFLAFLPLLQAFLTIFNAGISGYVFIFIAAKLVPDHKTIVLIVMSVCYGFFAVTVSFARTPFSKLTGMNMFETISLAVVGTIVVVISCVHFYMDIKKDTSIEEWQFDAYPRGSSPQEIQEDAEPIVQPGEPEELEDQVLDIIAEFDEGTGELLVEDDEVSRLATGLEGAADGIDVLMNGTGTPQAADQIIIQDSVSEDLEQEIDHVMNILDEAMDSIDDKEIAEPRHEPPKAQASYPSLMADRLAEPYETEPFMAYNQRDDLAELEKLIAGFSDDDSKIMPENELEDILQRLENADQPATSSAGSRQLPAMETNQVNEPPDKTSEATEVEGYPDLELQIIEEIAMQQQNVALQIPSGQAAETKAAGETRREKVQQVNHILTTAPESDGPVQAPDLDLPVQESELHAGSQWHSIDFEKQFLQITSELEVLLKNARKSQLTNYIWDFYQSIDKDAQLALINTEMFYLWCMMTTIFDFTTDLDFRKKLIEFFKKKASDLHLNLMTGNSFEQPFKAPMNFDKLSYFNDQMRKNNIYLNNSAHDVNAEIHFGKIVLTRILEPLSDISLTVDQETLMLPAKMYYDIKSQVVAILNHVTNEICS